MDKPKTAVMVVGPGGNGAIARFALFYWLPGFCKIVRPTSKLERVGDKYAEMLLEI